MLVKKLIEIRRSDAQLPPEIRAALVRSLFAPISSLTVGAINCSIIGMVVALSVGNDAIMFTSIAIFAVGMLRVVSAILYRRYKAADQPAITKVWERVYEAGAWAFSALLGVLCWLTLMQTDDPALQMAVITTATGYAAAISGRNAGRPFIALGQFTSIMLPMVVALFLYPDWVHKILGVVGLLFMWGMMDITLGIREVILQALTMTRKEAALAARFEEQANRFDIALNNMSHGLCMLDQQDRLQVWNSRFIDLLHLKTAPVRVGMKLPELLRHSIRAGNYKGKRPKQVFTQLVRGLQAAGEEQMQISPDGEKTIALSRRMMADGGSVVILEDVTERKRAQERISYLARYDDLTGLANRVQFNEELGLLLGDVRRGKSHVTLQLIDLDRFKTINDTLGHPIGDKLLKLVADRLRSIIRPNDLITRFGGDEFIVVQTGTDKRQDAEWLAQRLLRSIAEPFEVDGHRLDIGASIGIAMAPEDGIDADQLLKKADMALYAAKHSGRGGHQFFAGEMEEAVQVRRVLEIDMREALAADQFTLEFQPLIDLHTGKVTTCEALVRWKHPKRGSIPPAVFIPVAEETGMIIPLGQKILDMACLEAATWPNNIKVAVNLSPVQFKDPSLVLHIASALAKSGLRAQRLELEVTERLLLEESEETRVAIKHFEQLGVSLSLDDFGTGYSSLNYLHKFPFHKIKIDQSFVRNREADRDARAIVEAVANLGASLGKVVVAEGIETEKEMQMVKSLGVHQGQGYFFSAPMTATALAARLKSETPKAQLVA